MPVFFQTIELILQKMDENIYENFLLYELCAKENATTSFFFFQIFQYKL